MAESSYLERRESSINKISRRIFLKASALLGVTLAIGKYISTKTLSFAGLINPDRAAISL